MNPTRTPSRTLSRTLSRTPAAAALLALALAGTAHAEDPTHPGDTTCPGSPSQVLQQAIWSVPDPFLGLDLRPGTTRATTGTDIVLEPKLDGPDVQFETVGFSFMTPAGLVAGELDQGVTNAADHTCDSHYAVRVASASVLPIDRVIVTQFHHPKLNLFGNYRDDLIPGGTPSDHVSRSTGSGTTITFRIAVGVAPGHSSRPLLLDTNQGTMRKTAFVQLRASDGTLSGLIPTWGPVFP